MSDLMSTSLRLSEARRSLRQVKLLCALCVTRSLFLVLFAPNQTEQSSIFAVFVDGKQKRGGSWLRGQMAGQFPRYCCGPIAGLSLPIDILISWNKSPVGLFRELKCFNEVSY